MEKAIILISCCSDKQEYPCKAKELYVSSLFKKQYKFAEELIDNGKASNIFILSAKYGLVDPSDIKEPYDLTLNNMKVRERKAWATKVKAQLTERNLINSSCIILAGQRYCEFLLDSFSIYSLPLKNLRIGEQLAFLSKKYDEKISRVIWEDNNVSLC